jgi:hypothetical protein
VPLWLILQSRLGRSSNFFKLFETSPINNSALQNLFCFFQLQWFSLFYVLHFLSLHFLIYVVGSYSNGWFSHTTLSSLSGGSLLSFFVCSLLSSRVLTTGKLSFLKQHEDKVHQRGHDTQLYPLVLPSRCSSSSTMASNLRLSPCPFT